MNYLLDTHVWLWAESAPTRIPPAILRRLTDPEASLWLSPVSLWEASVLAERGRIRLRGARRQTLLAMYTGGPWLEAPLTGDVALASRDLDVATQDPADRFIAATAKVQGLTLVTADGRLLGAADVDVLSFRPRPA